MLGGPAWPTQPHSPSPRSTRTSSRASLGWWSASREEASRWRSRSRHSRRGSGSPGREQRNWRKRSGRWRCCWRVTGPRRSPGRKSRSNVPVARRRKHMPGRKKIIIVDDDRETREMLKMALELEGYEVSQAANGLRLISTLHVDRPDLILLDVMMSWIDGFELCRAVKKNDEFRDIPVIFISAKKTAGDIRTCLAAGAADYVSEPTDMVRPLARIQAAS